MMSPLVLAVNLVLFLLAVVSPIVLIVALVQLARTRRLLAELTARLDHPPSPKPAPTISGGTSI